MIQNVDIQALAFIFTAFQSLLPFQRLVLTVPHRVSVNSAIFLKVQSLNEASTSIRQEYHLLSRSDPNRKPPFELLVRYWGGALPVRAWSIQLLSISPACLPEVPGHDFQRCEAPSAVVTAVNMKFAGWDVFVSITSSTLLPIVV